MEDIAYLANHATEESYLFMCDSRLRDFDTYPTPSVYQVTFSTPFRNAFSVDLIDATIPRTEYVVEQGRNTLTYELQGGARRTITLQPGDYILPQLVEAMNSHLSAAGADEGLRVETLTIPSELSNKVKFTCSRPFVLYMDKERSGLRDCLGFANPVTPDDINYGGIQQFAAPPQWDQSRQLATWQFHSVPSGNGVTGATVLEGPVRVDAVEGVGPGVSLRQYFTPAVGGTPMSVTIQGYYTDAQPTPPTLAVSVHVAASPSPPPSPPAPVATTVATFAANEIADRGGVWTATFDGGIIPANTRCFVEIQCTATAAFVYRARSNAALAGNHGDVVTRVVDGVERVIDQTDEDLCVDLVVATNQHQLVSPGLVDLTGERYVTVRCPEVENLMFRERAFEKFHAGLGMVKLSGYGYREQRYDFVSFPPRRFHAKGIIDKLTIRLERADGTLYNAHGIDHTLLLVIRYYSPPQTGMSASRSILAPNYTPNLHAYLGAQKLAEQERRDFYNAYDNTLRI